MTLFEDILQQINARRDELFVRADEFVFNDYGAGARDENRSPEMMDIGVKCIKTLKDFAYIGVKNENAKLLFDTIRDLKPKIILELGCCLGFSSILFKAAFNKASIYTLEGDLNLANFAKENFDFFKFNDIKIVVGKFSDTLPKLLPKIDKIDFAFIDGHHDKNATIGYFEQILPFMNEGSVIAFDDINYNRNMTRAWDVIKQNKNSKDDGKIGIIWL
ncbi:class I SAM-dependent methyltransferase [Campylobacter fetus]|uniref:O-methyltransferase n=1 Tax=Campylobacter fetus TaxID=196 RepID=UPI0005092972|nr:class I SAM-dependent methyltransferase [Campylobacter fetus]WKW17219.1 class I SAM-dependent methyltransferase [Campylobacter fetus subsp. fetus]AIR79480.1 methyltransferase [Campylobacter fetus subsp. fetus 04/554]EAJ5694132.1 class I SAM-dependent methyltransferase [Campylobacter fetus]EAJ5705157.1 class I SAM-dependent methyltransferase [Campylobacter fetus]EAJ9257545.1 class I SAM-dependent methyltransferase [Campylobacter fetus]